MALTAISKMQQLGASAEDLAPLWERFLDINKPKEANMQTLHMATTLG